MRHREPAVAIWVGLIVAALGWDVWLIRNGYRPLTDAARRPVGLACLALFVAHVLRLLGPADPFTHAAHRIRRTPC